MPMFNYGYASATCYKSETDPKCIKNAHRGNRKSKIFSGEIPRTPLMQGGIPPLVLSPSLVPSALALTSTGPLLTTWRRVCYHEKFNSLSLKSNAEAEWLHRKCHDWLRYRHITYRTESENINIVYSTCRLSSSMRRLRDMYFRF